MQKTVRIAGFAGLALFLTAAAGCRVLGSVDVELVAWEGELIASIPAPTGTAAALSQASSTRASIQISGGPQEGGVFRWLIRTGSCSSPGSVVGGVALYPELDHEPPGSTGADAVLTDPMPAGRSYHVVLIRAEDDAEVACGQLERV